MMYRVKLWEKRCATQYIITSMNVDLGAVLEMRCIMSATLTN
jgi:hypothetical protein